MSLVERNYHHIYDQYVSLGPSMAANYGYDVTPEIEELKDELGTYTDGYNAGLPMLDEDTKVCDAVLRMSTASNGRLADLGWKKREQASGEKLTDIGRGRAEAKMTFKTSPPSRERLIQPQSGPLLSTTVTVTRPSP